MSTIHDIAAFIIKEQGHLTTMKLQKLCFYANAWSLAWEGEPLFASSYQAWKLGPVSPELYSRHQGQKTVTSWDGNPAVLNAREQATVRKVLAFYGKMSPEELSELTHRERPWRDARRGLGPDERSTALISVDAIKSYYGAFADSSKKIPEAFAHGCRLLLQLPEAEVDMLDVDDDVSGDAMLAWLSTGENDPWRAEPSD